MTYIRSNNSYGRFRFGSSRFEQFSNHRSGRGDETRRGGRSRRGADEYRHRGIGKSRHSRKFATYGDNRYSRGGSDGGPDGKVGRSYRSRYGGPASGDATVKSDLVDVALEKIDEIGAAVAEQLAPVSDRLTAAVAGDANGEHGDKIEDLQDDVDDVAKDFRRDLEKAREKIEDLVEDRHKYSDHEFEKKLNKAVESVIKDAKHEVKDLEKIGKKLGQLEEEIGLTSTTQNETAQDVGADVLQQERVDLRSEAVKKTEEQLAEAVSNNGSAEEVRLLKQNLDNLNDAGSRGLALGKDVGNAQAASKSEEPGSPGLALGKNASDAKNDRKSEEPGSRGLALGRNKNGNHPRFSGKNKYDENLAPIGVEASTVSNADTKTDDVSQQLVDITQQIADLMEKYGDLSGSTHNLAELSAKFDQTLSSVISDAGTTGRPVGAVGRSAGNVGLSGSSIGLAGSGAGPAARTIGLAGGSGAEPAGSTVGLSGSSASRPGGSVGLSGKNADQSAGTIGQPSIGGATKGASSEDANKVTSLRNINLAKQIARKGASAKAGDNAETAKTLAKIDKKLTAAAAEISGSGTSENDTLAGTGLDIAG